MKAISSVWLVAALLCGGCSDNPFGGQASVPEVIENIHAWDGKVYVVHGWLGKCEGLDCGLYATKADALLVAGQGEGWLDAMDRRLSIAHMSHFDDHAKPLQFQQVKVTALVEDYCRSWSRSCTDRSPDLIPFSIEPMQIKPKGK